MTETLDIERFFEEYIKFYDEANKKKDRTLERFREREERLKAYEEAISELEIIKNQIKFDLYKQEAIRFLQPLLNFDPTNIDRNTAIVYDEIARLSTLRHDISEVSSKYMAVAEFWRRSGMGAEDISKDALFIKDIEEELRHIAEEIENVSMGELQRLEDKIEAVRIKIERSVAMIRNVKEIIDDYVFIGDEEVEFREKIEDFVTDKYSNMPLVELSKYSEEIREEFNELKKNSKTIRKKIPVYKMINKNAKVHSYALKVDDIMINVLDIAIEDPIYIPVDRYVYVDNFPEHGIFLVEEIREEMEVPDEQFEAIKEFDRVTMNYFFIFVGIAFLTIILNMAGVLPIIQSILLVALYPLLFMLLFRKTKKKIDKKYKLPEFFHFYETNFFIIKEGDSLFKPQNIIPSLLLHFPQMFKIVIPKRR